MLRNLCSLLGNDGTQYNLEWSRIFLNDWFGSKWIYLWNSKQGAVYLLWILEEEECFHQLEGMSLVSFVLVCFCWNSSHMAFWDPPDRRKDFYCDIYFFISLNNRAIWHPQQWKLILSVVWEIISSSRSAWTCLTVLLKDLESQSYYS